MPIDSETLAEGGKRQESEDRKKKMKKCIQRLSNYMQAAGSHHFQELRPRSIRINCDLKSLNMIFTTRRASKHILCTAKSSSNENNEILLFDGKINETTHRLRLCGSIPSIGRSTTEKSALYFDCDPLTVRVYSNKKKKTATRFH